MTSNQTFAATCPDNSSEELRWQQQKAAMTRDSILSAAVDCLVESGYAGLTTIEVAKRAGVSRGALHHHFANRMELASALIDYVLRNRMERFLSEYASAMDGIDDSDMVATATEMHWQSVLTPHFTAYLELAMAARTDKDLADVLVPATKAFDRDWSNAMEEAFPQWGSGLEAMHLSSDFASAVHLGLLLNRPFFGDSKRRAAVRELAIRVIEEVYRSASK